MKKPMPLSPLHMRHSTRGMTLIELMIVVAVIGILASLAIMSFARYVEQGKLTEMRQYAMDVARGQEQFFSRNNQYYAPAANYTAGSHTDPQWSNLLEFSPQVPPYITVTVEAAIGGACGICADRDIPDAVAAERAWFAVLVQNDDLDRAIFYHSELHSPIEVTIAGD